MGKTVPRNPLVVMPALNESETIADVIGDVQKHAPHYTVLVVDDGSEDKTAQVAAAAGAQVLQLPFNLGVGGAMRAGFRYAVDKGHDAVIQVDADGQHPAEEIVTVVEKLGEVDVVVGARFAGQGTYKAPPLRRLVMSGLAFTLSRWAGTKLTDTTSGFRGSGPRAVDLYSRHYPVEYLGDTVESLVMANRAGLSIVQVPVQMRERQGGVPSQAAWQSGIYALRAIFVLFMARVRKWPQLPSVEA